MEKEIIESNGKKVSFITLGCKVNQYDSDAMRSLFVRNGYKMAKENENADVYVINTCSVTSIGDRKSRQMVRRIRREHPGAVIAAAGCYAQLAPDVFVQMGDVDVIVGIQNRSHIVEYVEEAAAEKKTLNAVGDIMAVTDFENLSVDAEGEVKTRAFIKVQEGCDNYCTFCIIPFARGKLKSRRQSDAVEEIRRLVEKGYREVVLTGIHLGNYGKDLHDGTSLSTLVTELVRIPDLLRIRLGSIESVELSDELIRIIREEPKVCPHLHLPIQAGSDDILKRMNRHYRLADSKIGKGTYCVCKGISTVLIPGTEIGENCVLGLRFSTVRQFPYKEVPHLKNNVWVGPNVIIAGPVVIEDDVIIAGNSFVNRSVPQGAIVAGCPAKIIGWRKNLDYAIETNPKYKEGHMPFFSL